ncbi:MAG: permease [Candidatus Omnitrophica bacterium]|nr:permease [Candidatus Omnitrophota bacterium]
MTALPAAGHCPSCETPQGRPWWKDQVLWALALVGFLLALGRFWPAAQPVSDSLWDYLRRAGWAVLLGLAIGGAIERYVPKEYISLWLAGRRRGTVLTSAGLGFLASSCSHGCLALSMELYRKGASVPAVITFLLASPWASLSMTLLIVSLMGFKGLLIVVLALGVAVLTGLIFQGLEARGLLASNPNTVPAAEGFSIGADFKRRFRRRRWTVSTLLADAQGIFRGGWELGQMVLFWVAVGFSLSAVLGSAVPSHWWAKYLGPTPLGLLITLAFAAAIEVCSEGTAPLAVELYRKSGALGNAFGFLMAGVVTDFTELAVVWKNLGRQAVGWLLLATLPQIFLLGMLMNLFGGR